MTLTGLLERSMAARTEQPCSPLIFLVEKPVEAGSSSRNELGENKRRYRDDYPINRND